jgi:predicted O-methyltransferase YrrM
MNSVLEKIINTQTVYNAEGKAIGIAKTSVSGKEGELIQSVIKRIKAEKSVEIGLAFGVSALYICDALEKNKETKHYVIDPFQYDENAPWAGGVGLFNLKKAGFESIVSFIAQPSHLALAGLENANEKVDFAFIDGCHTFDHAIVDFFMIDKILKVGGVIVFDDTNWESLTKVCSFVMSNRNYRVYDYIKDGQSTSWKRNLLQGLVKFLGRVPKLKNYIKQSQFELQKITEGGSLVLQKKGEDIAPWNREYFDF